MQLVEVIRGAQTSDETVATAVAFRQERAQDADRRQRRPGLSGEPLVAAVHERSAAFDPGRSGHQGCRKGGQGFGMPMGRSRCTTWWARYGAVRRHGALRGVPRQVQRVADHPGAGRGRPTRTKNEAGFFAYGGKKKKGAPDPETRQVLAPHVAEPKKFKKRELCNRMFLPMLNEASRLIEEKIVRDPRDIDSGHDLWHRISAI